MNQPTMGAMADSIRSALSAYPKIRVDLHDLGDQQAIEVCGPCGLVGIFEGQLPLGICTLVGDLIDDMEENWERPLPEWPDVERVCGRILQYLREAGCEL